MGIPRAAELAVDLRVLGFGLVLSLLAGLLAGIAPALRVSSASPREAMGAMGSGRGAIRGGKGLPGGARSSPSRWRSRWCSW